MFPNFLGVYRAYGVSLGFLEHAHQSPQQTDACLVVYRGDRQGSASHASRKYGRAQLTQYQHRSIFGSIFRRHRDHSNLQYISQVVRLLAGRLAWKY